jgi:hypothetical protein
MENCVDPIVRLDLSEKRTFVPTGIRTQDRVESSLVATPTTSPDTTYIFMQALVNAKARLSFTYFGSLSDLR